MKLSSENLKWNIELTFGYAPALYSLGLRKLDLEFCSNEELILLSLILPWDQKSPQEALRVE